MKKILLVIVFLFFTSLNSFVIKGEVNKETPPLTYENLYEEIVRYGIKFPDVVFAQAVLETGHFSSKLYKEANNLFGMKMPRRRETLAIGKESRGFAIFEDWTVSVNDYLLWQDYVLKKNNIDTKSEYLAYLSRNYASDVRYRTLLNKVISKHQHIFK